MTARDTEVKFLTAAVNCQPVCIAVAQMRPTATNVARSVVCVFVSGTPESPTETAETNRDAVLGMQWGSVGPKNRVSDRVQVGAT